jgi:hypothetical protein
MNPIVVSRNESECVLIEGSINSVRISVKVKKADDLEDFLAKKFMRCRARHVLAPPPLPVFSVRCRFLSQRAESFVVLRRKPIAVRVCSHDVIDAAHALSFDALAGFRHLLFDHKFPHGIHVQEQSCGLCH